MLSKKQATEIYTALEAKYGAKVVAAMKGHMALEGILNLYGSLVKLAPQTSRIIDALADDVINAAAAQFDEEGRQKVTECIAEARDMAQVHALLGMGVKPS